MIGLTAVLLFAIAGLSQKFAEQWRRYWASVTAIRPRFFYHDDLLWLIAILSSLSIAKSTLGFNAFLGFTIASGLVCLLLTRITFQIPQTSERTWLSDDPIENDDEDLLGRLPFVDNLSVEIGALPFSSSYVFGLYGGLGEGKTSVINLLKKRFCRTDTHFSIDFDPWSYPDERSMASAFYLEVEKAIRKTLIVPGFKRTLSKYHKLLSPEISPFGIKLGFKIEEGLEGVRLRVENYIVNTKRKLLIIVDDIDRLQASEILSIFKLIRLNAKFRNTVFILVFDRDTVDEKLQSIPGIGPEYLEKFIQKGVRLPAVDDIRMEKFFDANLDELWDEMDLSQDEQEVFTKEFAYLYHRDIKRLFKTLRRTKIYLSSLRSSLPSIYKEVNIFDFSILELLKVFYPRVYADIWRYRHIYVPFSWSDDAFLADPFLFERDDTAKYQKIRTHVDRMLEGLVEREIVKKLLETIFPVHVKNAFSSGSGASSAQTYRIERRITHPESFVKYFMLDIPERDIADEEVSKELKRWEETQESARELVIAKSFFEFQKRAKLAAFLKRLNLLRNEIPQTLIPSIITAVSKNAGKFSKEGGGFERFFRSEWDKGRSLLFALINERIEKRDIPRVLEGAAVKTPYIPLAVTIGLNSANRGEGSLFNIYQAVDIQALREAISRRLKERFIDTGENIFDEYPDKDDWSSILYEWATNWMTSDQGNYETVNDYLMKLCEADESSLMKVLGHCLEFQNRDELERVYDLERLVGLIETYKKEEPSSDGLNVLAAQLLAKFSEQPMATAALPAFIDRPEISEETTTSADNQQDRES